MGKMKDLVIEMEERFYSELDANVSIADDYLDFESEAWEYRHLLPLATDDEFVNIIFDFWLGRK